MDYSKKKNVELETLCKERSLPHTGKKADLVKRLEEHDAKTPSTADTSTAPTPAATSAPKLATTADDEIDWDDEPATTAVAEATQATTEPAKAAMEAGGVGRVKNPQAVPNQEAAIDPATTSDLKVVEPANDEAAPAPAADTKEDVKPKVDFSIGLAASNLDEEIAKRKARAKKFGQDENKDEELKRLEREKKFGKADAVPGLLDQALPERGPRQKRGREADADHNRDGSKRRNGGGRPTATQQESKDSRPAKIDPVKKAVGGMSEADKARIEARKAKYAAAA